jgi:hypothetical protein
LEIKKTEVKVDKEIKDILSSTEKVLSIKISASGGNKCQKKGKKK